MNLLFVWLGFFLTATVGNHKDCGWLVEGVYWDETHCNTVVKPSFIEVSDRLALLGPNYWKKSPRDLSDLPTLHSKVKELHLAFDGGTHYIPRPDPAQNLMNPRYNTWPTEVHKLYPAFMITRAQYAPSQVTNCFGLKLTTKFLKPDNFRKHGADRFMDPDAKHAASRREVRVDFNYGNHNKRCLETSECRIHFINGKPSISSTESFNFATADKTVSMYYFFGPGQTISWEWSEGSSGGHLWNGLPDVDSQICTPFTNNYKRCRGIFFVYVRWVFSGFTKGSPLEAALNESLPSSRLTQDIWRYRDPNGFNSMPEHMIRGFPNSWDIDPICNLATYKNFRESHDAAYMKVNFDPVIGNELGIYSASLEISTTLFGSAKSSEVSITVESSPQSDDGTMWFKGDEPWRGEDKKMFIVDPCGRVDHMGRGASVLDDKIAKVMCYTDMVTEEAGAPGWLGGQKQCVSPESQSMWAIDWQGDPARNKFTANTWGARHSRHSYCLGYVDYNLAEDICSDLGTFAWLWAIPDHQLSNDGKALPEWEGWSLPGENTDFSQCCGDGISNSKIIASSAWGSVDPKGNQGVTCTRNWESSMIWTSIEWTEPGDKVIDFLGADFYDIKSDRGFGKPISEKEPSRVSKMELTTISGPTCNKKAHPSWMLNGFNVMCSGISDPGEELKVSLSYEHASQIGWLKILVKYQLPNDRDYESEVYFHISIHHGLYMQIYLNDKDDPFSAPPYHSVFLDRGSINFDVVDIDSYLPETIQSNKWGVLLKGSFRKNARGEFCNLGLYSSRTTQYISAKWDGQLVPSDSTLFNPISGQPVPRDRSGAKSIFWQQTFVRDRFYDYEFRLWDVTYPRLLWLDLRWWCDSHKLYLSRDFAHDDGISPFAGPNFDEFVDPQQSTVYLHRLVPRECFVSRSGSPLLASPQSITERTCYFANTRNDGIVSVDYSLFYPPTSDVVITFTSELPLDVCSMTFTSTNYNVVQTLRFSTSYTHQHNPDGPHLQITGTASSNDPKFDDIDINVPIEGGWWEDCFSVQNFSATPHACFVSVDGAVKSFSAMEMHEPRQVKKHSYVWLVKSDANYFHIQARADQCSGQACVTSATIYYHGDVYSVYKEVNNKFLTLNHLGNLPATGPILDLVEDGDCWIFSSATGIRAEFCVVDKQFVDIFVYLPVGALFQNPTIDGLCFGDLTAAGYPDATSCNLNFFPEIKPPSPPSSPRNVFPFLPIVCSTPDATFRDHIRSLLPASAQAISTKRIKLIRNVDIERFQPRALNKLCSTPGFITAMGGDVRKLLLGEPGKTTCERLQKSGHELRVALQSSRQLVYGIIQYFMWTGGIMDSNPTGTMFKDYVENNPRLCGPFAEPRSTGCRCKDPKKDFPLCTGVTFDGEDPNNAKEKCTSYVSVIVDQYTGQVWKCFKGYCQYSYNGAHWIGMPKNLKTPYCIVAISWSDLDKTQDQTLWAISNAGIDIASTDRGITWSVLTHNWDSKLEYMAAITSFSSDHNNEAALVIDGVSRVVPHDSFDGRGSDKWWLTPEELCVQSEGLSAWHDVMVSCSKWFCQCVDPDEWLSTFGIPVPETPDAPLNETTPVPGAY